MKSTHAPFTPLAAIAGAAFVAAMALSHSAFADATGDTTDPVTGYHCVNQGCQTLALPNADCICVKQNPGEENVNQLVLACSTKEDGQWVACPVKPKYGISAR